MSSGPRVGGLALWPRYTPEALAEITDFGNPWALFIGELAVAALLSLPPVVRATGIHPLQIAADVGFHVGCCMLNLTLFKRRWLPPDVTFQVITFVFGVAGVGATVAFPVLAHDPKSPLWMAAVMYACMNGAIQEVEPSFELLAMHALGPLLSIPFFRGPEGLTAWALAGPVVAGGLSGFAYIFIGRRSSVLRALRQERDQIRADLVTRERELERVRLAQDLHDSVGSTLSLVALYGELIEQHADRPDELRKLAASLKEAASEGLGDLRGLMWAIAPSRASLGALAESLRRVAARASATVDVEVVVSGAESLEIDGRARMALVRTFQEALNNALRHGKARHVVTELRAGQGDIELVVRDDGAGISREAPEGRGLPGMRKRAEELGGACEVKSGETGGTTVRLRVPFIPEARA